MTELGGEMIVYRSPDGGTRVQLRAVQGTVWLTQAQIAELYGTSVQNIDQIVRRVLDDQEVSTATINSELKVRTEGKRLVQRTIKVYNLDMVLAVGYRVSTPRAVQFRQWSRRCCASSSSRASHSTTSGSRIPPARTTSTSCWPGFGTSGRRRSASTRRSSMSSRQARTTTAPRTRRGASSPPSRTSCSSRSPGARRPNSSCGDATQAPQPSGSPPGRASASARRTSLSRRTI